MKMRVVQFALSLYVYLVRLRHMLKKFFNLVTSLYIPGLTF